MLIHTDRIEYSHLHAALRDVGLSAQIDIEDHDRLGSRSRNHKHKLRLTACDCARHTRRPNMGTADVYRFDNPERAATWMDWGWWIAALFRFEPTAIIGQYDGQEDFFRQTAAMLAHRARIDREVRNFLSRWAPGIEAMQHGSPFEMLDFFHPVRELVDFHQPPQVETWLAAS